MIRVCLAGATGWVGKPLAAAVETAEDLELVAAVARRAQGEPLGRLTISGSVEEALAVPSDVFVDYTSALTVKANVLALRHHRRVAPALRHRGRTALAVVGGRVREFVGVVRGMDRLL
jgi:dihydrodipicolinate reductase